MKRISVLIFSVLILSSVLSAAPLEDILAKAEENSLTVKNATLTYNNNILTQQANDLDDKVSIEVSSGNVGYSKSLTENGGIYEGLSANPSVTVTLPNDGKTVIKAGLGFNAKLDGSLYGYSPSASVAHTFDFGYSDDSLTAFNESYSAIQTDSTYLKSLNSFKSSMFTQIKTIMNLELNIKKLEKSISDSEKAIEDNLTLELYSPATTTYKKAMLDLNKNKATLNSYTKQLDAAKERYKVATGLEWDGITNIPDVDVTFTPQSGGNSDVVLSSIAVEQAQENIKVKNSSLKPNSLTLSGSVNSTITDTTSTSYSITPSATVTYNIGNITLGSSIDAAIKRDNVLPSFSMSFTWKNDTTSEKDSIELQKLQNSLIKAQNDYQQELLDYNDSVTALYQEIEDYKASLDENAIQREYYQALLEVEQELLKNGLSTEDNVNDIIFDAECEEVNYQILCLDGLILQLKIEAMSI